MASDSHVAALRNVNSAGATSCTFRWFLAVGVGGTIVGVLDLAYAMLVYSPRHPLLIPQHIASGILGQRSFQMGMSSVVLGTLLHFLIALTAAQVYFAVSLKVRVLIDRPYLCGILYGGWVYLFMHFVILPLSAAAPSHLPTSYKIAEFVEHWFFVGIPISLSIRHFIGQVD